MTKKITYYIGNILETIPSKILLFGLLLCSCSLIAQEKNLLLQETLNLDKDQGKVEVSIYNHSANTTQTNTSTGTKPYTVPSGFSSSNLLSTCNSYSEINGSIYSTGEPLESTNCSPSDTLEICFNVLEFSTGGSCQYLHGLVPDFNDYFCIEPLAMTPEGEPGIYTVPFTNNTFAGEWVWQSDGIALYNEIPDGYYDPYEPVGAGWFYLYHQGNSCADIGNPNCTFGDGANCTDFGFTWEVCFLAKAKCVDTGIVDCELSFRTFSDGETGGWNQPGCQEDQPWEYNFSIECCEQPIITVQQTEYEQCSGDLFELELTSNMDPETTYEWVVNPGTYGATAGSGNTISDVLYNPTCSPVTETYYITPTCAFGCVGEVFIVTVTIFPEVEVIIPTFIEICEFDQAVLIAQISCQDQSTFLWSTGQTSDGIGVGPGFYGVTVTNSFGCTGVAFTQVEEIPKEIEVYIEAPLGTEVCEGDPIELVAVGFPEYLAPFNYYWSDGSSEQTISPTSSGFYSVTITSPWDQCFYEAYAGINVIINPLPTVEVNASENQICPGECVVVSAQTGGNNYNNCIWNNGFEQPTFTDCPTVSTVYQVVVTDDNGCTATAETYVEVIQPLFPPGIVCTATENSIEFSWSAVPGAIGYNVNGTFQTTTAIFFDNLLPNETINITVEAIGSNGCESGFSASSCTTTDCEDIELQISPTTSFCENDLIIDLEVNETGGQWYGPGIVEPNLGLFDPAEADIGNNEIIYVLNNGVCEYTAVTEITVDEALEAPEIICNSTVSSVSFSWGEVEGATAYIVNGVEQSGTSYEANSLQPNEQVTISVEAINDGTCGNSFAQSTCIAEDCPIMTLQIEEVESLCETSGSISLQINTTGGEWSGPGITDAENGIFDPATATPGVHSITCNLSDGSCEYSETIDIEVVEALEVFEISCSSTTNSVSFSWEEVDGATGYIVNGVLQNSTSFEVNSLSPNEVVGIAIEALSGNACGSSFTQSSCVAQDCPTIVLQLEEVTPLCQYGSSISLQANEQGGQWSGPGITDASNGTFNPTFANEGVNTVEYILSNGSCSYSESIEIEVEPALDLPVITCASTESSVSFAWQEIAGATGYVVNGILQNGTSFEVTGLQPNEATTIMVEAVSG
ncbi:MAG: PKD-like domain-containing protein, partial [Saprospiraceae bacterium]